MTKKILAVILLTVFLFSMTFALDIKDILKQNIGHSIQILFKNTEDVESWGRIIDVSDEFLITQYEKKTTYIRIDEIAIFIIDDDVTRKK
jgi:hypothetical protein